MEKALNCKGLACPAPVLKTKETIEQEHPDTISVIVDSEASKQNVTRFLESQNFRTTVTTKDGDFHIIGTKEAGAKPPETPPEEKPETEEKKIMVMIATDRMGYGDDELGKKLIASFITTLKEMGEELWRLVFVNNGVKLTIQGSEVLDVLKEYEKSGLKILVCGTCLTYFNLLDKKLVGETTNMLDIVTAMQLADKVINI